MKLLDMLRKRIGLERHRTAERGVFWVENEDGTRTYLATWKEERPINITDPLTTRRVTVEERADSFEAACDLKARREVAERNKRGGQPTQSTAHRLAERVMAGKWFEYWVRR